MGSMHMEADEIFHRRLLSTVYKQYWPVPAWNKLLDEGNKTSDRNKAADPPQMTSCLSSKPAIRRHRHHKKKFSTARNSQINPKQWTASFAKLDTITLQKLGWAPNERSCEQNDVTVDDDLAQGGDVTRHVNDTTNQEIDDRMYKLTKTEFWRLTDQVRDVSMGFSHKFRTSSSIKQSYRPDGTPWTSKPNKDTTQVYRSQLASSLKAFQKKKWTPFDTDDILNSQVLQCRPVSCLTDRRQQPSRCSSALSTSKSPKRSNRPCSVPVGAYHHPHQIADDKSFPCTYDSLSPHVLSNLIVDKRPQSAFGDRVPSLESVSSPRSGSTNQHAGEDRRNDTASPEVSSTSGIESDDSDSSDDEAGTGEEPKLGGVLQIPQMALRPEKLDLLHFTSDKRDPRMFDFDAEYVDIPEYQFADALPDSLNGIDFKTVCEKNEEWAIPQHFPKDPMLEKLIKRLIEIEKLQIETEETEKRRKPKQPSSRAKSQRSTVITGKPTKERPCCSECLQIACTGNCIVKQSLPDKCGDVVDNITNGGSVDLRYDQRMRQPPLEEEARSERPVRPKSCNSCQRSHTAKYINVNNVILGRPRSSHSTYSRGQGSSKPKDLRTSDNNKLEVIVVAQFEKLGMNPCKPAYSKPQKVLRGRNAMLPGKSYFSQRKNSLTGTEIKQKLKAMAGKRMKTQRSAKRPITAE